MRKSRTSIASGLALAAVLAMAGPVGAYVRTVNASGVAIRWEESCVTVSPDLRGSNDLSNDEIENTLRRAVDNWNRPNTACSYMTLMAQPATRIRDVGSDGRPTVVFRQQAWQRSSGMPYDPGAIGLTTVFTVVTPGQPGDGTILDADIELNGVNYTFTTDPTSAMPRPGTEIADLENTLTHELGHVQGLAHNCWDHIAATPPLDDTGNPIPDCAGDLPPSITDATMFPFSSPGDIGKRTLSSDDTRAICDTYPNKGPAPACYQHVVGGCGLVGRDANATLLAIIVCAGGAVFACGAHRRMRKALRKVPRHTGIVEDAPRLWSR
jgi:hypothetical protein